MAQNFFNPFPTFVDSAGAPYASGTLEFYESGTSTPLATYPTQADVTALTNANDNPLTLNSAGRPSGHIFLLDQDYKVVLKDSAGTTVWTADPVRGVDFTTQIITKVYAGDPNGNVAGTQGSAGVLPTMVWDYTNDILYVCTTTGTAAAAVWTAINAQAATSVVLPPQGYLTLVSGTPMPASNQASKTTLYYTPDTGNQIPIYNGSKFVPTTFAELTLTLVASHAASTLYDVFVWSESGTVTVGTGPAWSTSTAGSGARGSGAGTTEISRVLGYYTNAVSATMRNGNTTYTVGANLATYVGTIFMDGTNGQLTCNVGFGQSRKWGVWNAFNRKPLFLKAGDGTASWAYNTATIRASNNDSTNSLTVLSGLAEEFFDLRFVQHVQIDESAATSRADVGIGWNSTSAMSGRIGTLGSLGDAGTDYGGNGVAEYIREPDLGVNVVTALENASTVATAGMNWFGTEAFMQLSARWRG